MKKSNERQWKVKLISTKWYSTELEHDKQKIWMLTNMDVFKDVDTG